MSESSAPVAVADEPGGEVSWFESPTVKVTAAAPTAPPVPAPRQGDADAVTEELRKVVAAVKAHAGRHRRPGRSTPGARLSIPGPRSAEDGPRPSLVGFRTSADGSRSIVIGPQVVHALRLGRTLGPLALVALMLAACSTSSAPPAPPTARVQRADVTTAVSSSGSLSAVTEQNIGFNKAGQLKTVAVEVGQKVTAGQVLATLDDVTFRQILAEQQGELASQQANLTRLINATTVRGAQNSTDQAKDILDATKDQKSQTVDADQSAVDQAEKALDVAKDAQDDADDTLDNAKDLCEASQGGSSSSSSSSISDILNDDSLTAAEKEKKVEAALKAAGTAAGAALGNIINNPCAAQATAQANADQADATVQSARSTLDAAKNRVDVDRAAQQVQIENAQQGVVSAQNDLDSARTDRPSLIAAQRGLVAAQAAVVAQAQKDVNDTVLRAPADGTVTAVNGAAGEYVQAGSVTTPLAPGTGGAIPGAGTSTSTTPGTVPRPGGTQLIVLDNVDEFDVVVPFEESDASQISPNQQVNVSFDAIPDLTLPGTVVSVSPSATVLAGVISYYATVRLTQGDPRLKNGQTAQAAVITTAVNDVLTVPNSAVHRQGDTTTVTVQGFDGQRVVPFQPGAVGDDRTQVLSGLTEGDEVVVPSGTTS